MYSKEHKREIKTLFYTSFGKYMSKNNSSTGKIKWLNYPTQVKDIYFRISLETKYAEVYIDLQHHDQSLRNLFFDQFFMVLILVDVVLLLISFFYTDQFHKIIRNSGFVISTILIRMSFGVSGLVSTILIVAAVVFGLAIITIHNKYEKNTLPNN